MKKLSLILMTALFVLALAPMDLKAGTETKKADITAVTKALPVDSDALITRLNDIKSIDTSNLSANEIKQLNKEARSIEATLSKLQDGGYIVVGAGTVLLIILLVILLV